MPALPYSHPLPLVSYIIIGTRARELYPGGCPMRCLEIGEARGAEERESVRKERGRGRGQEGIKYPFIGIS